jgi:hypothetical protein
MRRLVTRPSTGAPTGICGLRDCRSREIVRRSGHTVGGHRAAVTTPMGLRVQQGVSLLANPTLRGALAIES